MTSIDSFILELVGRYMYTNLSVSRGSQGSGVAHAGSIQQL